jgi:O-antigen/teichoic acid export membrane protein
MLRKALVILSGNAMTSLLLLARNLIIARMIPIADYGVAATFALAMAVVEMTSAFGLQQQIIQSKRGDDPHFQAALQGFQVMRGVISSLILFAMAGPLARFMGIPEVIWAYQVMAIVPVINALAHFDIHRLTRHMRFHPMILAGLVPAVAALAIVWPLAHWLGDWRVMLWSILAQAVIAAAASHIMAERPYRLVWDRAIISGSIRFGWPLLVNTMLLFFVFQGDKLVVGRVLGMEMLAIFAMGVTLTLTPTLVLAKSTQNLFLPKLSLAAGTPAFNAPAVQCLQIIALASLTFTFATLLVGGPVVTALLGAKYAALLPLLIWFAVGQALRVMKAGPSIVALAMGRSKNAMAANLVRVASLPVAYMVAVQGGSLLDIIWIAIIGEGLGLVVSVALMLRCTDLPAKRIIVQQGFVAAMILAAGAAALIFPPDAGFARWPVWIGAGLGLGLAVALMPETWRHFRRMRVR